MQMLRLDSILFSSAFSAKHCADHTGHNIAASTKPVSVQVLGLTSILAIPFTPLMLITFGASLEAKPIPATQVRPRMQLHMQGMLVTDLPCLQLCTSCWSKTSYEPHTLGSNYPLDSNLRSTGS